MSMENFVLNFDNSKYTTEFINNMTAEDIKTEFGNLMREMAKIKTDYFDNDKLKLDKSNESNGNIGAKNLWNYHKSMYKTFIQKIAALSEKKTIETTQYDVYKFKYNKDICEHEFFMEFLISLIGVNYHKIPENYKIPNKIAIRLINANDKGQRKFNGFTTLQCIFDKTKEMDNPLQKQQIEYTNVDADMIGLLDKGYTYENESDKTMVEIINNLRINQVLSYIELCKVKFPEMKMIKQLKQEALKSLEVTKEIPEEFLRVMNDKIKKINAVNMMNREEINETILQSELKPIKEKREPEPEQVKGQGQGQEQGQVKGQEQGQVKGQEQGQVKGQEQEQVKGQVKGQEQKQKRERRHSSDSLHRSASQKKLLNKTKADEAKASQLGGDAHHKYLKYKLKYMHLKNNN